MTKIEHPKEEPVWHEATRNSWYLQSPGRSYANLFVWDGGAVWGCAFEGAGRAARAFELPDDVTDPEQARSVIEDAVRQWRSEGVLV